MQSRWKVVTKNGALDSFAFLLNILNCLYGFALYNIRYSHLAEHSRLYTLDNIINMLQVFVQRFMYFLNHETTLEVSRNT